MYKFQHDGINFEVDVDGYVPDPEGGEPILAKTFYGFPDSLIAQVKKDSLREARSQLLAETDWWVLPDRAPTQAQLEYRQALRDITDNYSSLADVVWPEKPEA